MVSEAIKMNFHISELYTDYLPAVWYKFHVHSLFYSEVIEKRKTSLFSMYTFCIVLVPRFLWKIWKNRISLLLVVSRVWNELRTSNLHQYESFDLKKLSEYCLNCICMVSIWLEIATQRPHAKATEWKLKEDCSTSPVSSALSRCHSAFAMSAEQARITTPPHVNSVNLLSRRITPNSYKLFIVYPARAFEF